MKSYKKQEIKKELKMKRCAYCFSEENLTIDHKHPIILGGTDDKKNLQCLCKRCNQMKSGLPHGTLMKLFEWYETTKTEKADRKEEKRLVEIAKRLPDSICSLPQCTLCQKFRLAHGFGIKKRTK